MGTNTWLKTWISGWTLYKNDASLPGITQQVHFWYYSLIAKED